MANKLVTIVKKHPIATTVVGATVFIGVWLVASGGLGGGVSSSGGTGTVNPTTAAELAEQEQTNQDALSSQANQDQFQLAYLQQQQQLSAQQDTEQYNLGVASLADQTTVAQQQLATQLATTENTNATQLQGLDDQLSAQQAIDANNNATAVQQDQIIAGEQEFTTAAAAQVETIISNNNTLVATDQINSNVAIAKINAGEAESIASTNAEGSAANLGIIGVLGALF